MPHTTTPNPPSGPAPGSTPTGVDNGALPSDGEQTVRRPEPERESSSAQRDRPATGTTPSGAAGGRRI